MSHVSPRLIFILAAIIALGPLSIDLYLPAMPSMVVFFGADVSSVQLTLSSYLLGFALFHLACGPLSDRYGRKPVLLGGLTLYVLMSACCAIASSVEELVIFRFFQAMGACCAPTLGRAIVRDVYPPEDAVKALAYVSSLMAIAPVVAPSLGGFLLSFTDWRFLFWCLVFFGVVAMLLTHFCVPESLPEKQSLKFTKILANYAALLRHRLYLGSVLTSAFLYSGTFAFLSGISFILIDFLGVKPAYFGAYFLFIVAGYISGNLFTARIAHRWPSIKLFRVGLSLSLAAGLALTGICLMQWYVPVLMVLPVFFMTFSIGLILPKATALALMPFPHMAATASAFMGFAQMAVAGLAGWLVGVFLVDNPLPMALVLLATAICTWLSYWFLLPKSVLEK